jgi:hypothetical protein
MEDMEMADNYVVKGYNLVWKSQERTGEVRLDIISDSKPEIVIRVDSAAELVAWDILLRDKSMKKVTQEGWIVTGMQPV